MRLITLLKNLSIFLLILLIIIIIFLIKDNKYYNKIIDGNENMPNSNINVPDANNNMNDYYKWAIENGKYFITNNPTESHHVSSKYLFKLISENKEYITQEDFADFIDNNHILNEETEYTSDGKVIEGQRTVDGTVYSSAIYIPVGVGVGSEGTAFLSLRDSR